MKLLRHFLVLSVISFTALVISCRKEGEHLADWPPFIRLEAQSDTLLGLADEVRYDTLTISLVEWTLSPTPLLVSIENFAGWKGEVYPATPQDTITTHGYLKWVYQVTLSRRGDIVIRATVGDVNSTATIHLEVIGGIALESPTTMWMTVEADSIGKETFSVQVYNLEGLGISNLTVLFDTDIGWLENITRTDFNGRATADFYIRPSTDFPPGATEAVAHIRISIPGTSIQTTMEIVVRKR